jgi:hypothetical protein
MKNQQKSYRDTKIRNHRGKKNRLFLFECDNEQYSSHDSILVMKLMKNTVNCHPKVIATNFHRFSKVRKPDVRFVVVSIV